MANERKRIRQDGAAMPSALVSLPAWISVEKSRPSRNDAVWVFDGTDVFMAEHWGGSVWMSYGASRDREGLNSERISGVTHWMEIAEPAPPSSQRTTATGERSHVQKRS